MLDYAFPAQVLAISAPEPDHPDPIDEQEQESFGANPIILPRRGLALIFSNVHASPVLRGAVGLSSYLEWALQLCKGPCRKHDR